MRKGGAAQRAEAGGVEEAAAALAAVKEEDEEEEHESSSSDSGKLYEAYNELHGLAQEFETPFDVPAVLVVGHQTDGKSALVEALMGFQFNHVGGGTKTRRPITLHMKYNSGYVVPVCRLVSDADPAVASRMSLPEIQVEFIIPYLCAPGDCSFFLFYQAYIEAENMRLESDPCQFSEKEIIIRIEYKYCPNLTIIDTPGLIIPAPGRRNRTLQLSLLLKGTVVAPPDKFGETSLDERTMGGPFTGTDSLQLPHKMMPVSSAAVVC
ncbi:hypothetical protein B296_00001300 [Ensete ventricosum]|uniref:Dynamin-type G domain-containing protein n=1 Tax=Ensete ventricosum TaxID=4639 RepID=A0A427AJH4_ENSVE|nr:hypothetical protein B296_00001300 [Ensete ventricosum]